METHMHAKILHINVHRSYTYTAKIRTGSDVLHQIDGQASYRSIFIPRKYYSVVKRSTYSYMQQF